MLKLGKAAGPCNLCGATGLIEVWDSEGEYEPCEACKGTGYNSGNFVVVERESKRTKFTARCQILDEAYVDVHRGSETCDWAMDYLLDGDYYTQVSAGVYLARMCLVGDAGRKRAEYFVDRAFESLLEHYKWKQDMGFKYLSEIIEGGQYWSEAEG